MQHTYQDENATRTPRQINPQKSLDHDDQMICKFSGSPLDSQPLNQVDSINSSRSPKRQRYLASNVKKKKNLDVIPLKYARLDDSCYSLVDYATISASSSVHTCENSPTSRFADSGFGSICSPQTDDAILSSSLDDAVGSFRGRFVDLSPPAGSRSPGERPATSPRLAESEATEPRFDEDPTSPVYASPPSQLNSSYLDLIASSSPTPGKARPRSRCGSTPQSCETVRSPSTPRRRSLEVFGTVGDVFGAAASSNFVFHSTPFVSGKPLPHFQPHAAAATASFTLGTPSDALPALSLGSRSIPMAFRPRLPAPFSSSRSSVVASSTISSATSSAATFRNPGVKIAPSTPRITIASIALATSAVASSSLSRITIIQTQAPSSTSHRADDPSIDELWGDIDMNPDLRLDLSTSPTSSNPRKKTCDKAESCDVASAFPLSLQSAPHPLSCSIRPLPATSWRPLPTPLHLSSSLGVSKCSACQLILPDSNNNQIDVCDSCVVAGELLVTGLPRNQYLIGRKVGVDLVDIIGELFCGGQAGVVYVNIMKHLSQRDVYTFSNVSHKWRDICMMDKNYNRKRLLQITFQQKLIIEKENYKKVRTLIPKEKSKVNLMMVDTGGMTRCSRCGGQSRLVEGARRADCLRCTFSMCTKCHSDWHTAVQCRPNPRESG